MEQQIQDLIKQLYGTEPDQRYACFQTLMKITAEKVDWQEEVWADLLNLMRSGDNHQRTIAVQLLVNLAKSDTNGRMLHDLDQLLEVTRDERFVTARHSLQSLWKLGLVNDALKQKLLEGLSKRFKESGAEKNGTLIRYDILEVFRKINDHSPDESMKPMVQKLIQSEADPKYRKKYLTLWKELNNSKVKSQKSK
jgi:hypothetical protein